MSRLSLALLLAVSATASPSFDAWAAAHGKAAKGPHSPQLLTGVGSQHLWSVHFSGMGSLCDMHCSYRGVALRGRLYTQCGGPGRMAVIATSRWVI